MPPRPNETEVALFWSYVHSDDDAEGGRITRLARLLAQEYELISGEPLSLFIDRNLEWGDAWRQRIDDALAQTTFFVAVVTPRYLASVECRRELLTFAARARDFGAAELVLPIRYAVLPDGEPDDVRQVIEEHQWEDWSALRLEEESSSVHRQAVARLAARLQSAATDLETRPVRVVGSDDADDDAEGLLDRFEAVTAAGERLSTLGPELNRAMEEINQALTEFGPALRASGGSATVAAAHRLAQRIEEPTILMEQRVAEAGAAFREMDSAIFGLIELASISPDLRSQLLGLRPQILDFDRQFAAMGDGAETAQMIQIFGNISRELRRPFRRLADTIRMLADMRDLVERWEASLNALSSQADDETAE